MAERIIKNKFWKNPYNKKYTQLVLLFLFVNFCGIIFTIFYTSFMEDIERTRIMAFFLIFSWVGGIYYLRKFHKEKVVKYEEEHKYSKLVTESEYKQLEREHKLKRILKTQH